MELDSSPAGVAKLAFRGDVAPRQGTYRSFTGALGCADRVTRWRACDSAEKHSCRCKAAQRGSTTAHRPLPEGATRPDCFTARSRFHGPRLPRRRDSAKVPRSLNKKRLDAAPASSTKR